MKKLLLLSLFIFPVIACFAQRFEVSEQAGMSFTNTTYQKNGFANQVAFGYHPLRHLEVSAFYELNKWVSTNNSFGLSVDYTTRYFFVGLEGKCALMAPYEFQPFFGENIRYTYKPSLSYGLHAGAKQKLTTRFSLVEQLGYMVIPFKNESEVVSVYSSPPVSMEYNSIPMGINYFYARLGISYRL